MIEEQQAALDSPVVVPSDQIVYTAFDDGEGVLVDLKTKKYFRLNQTAMFVWDRIEQRKLPRVIAGEMSGEFEVTHERALESVEKFLSSLKFFELVEPGK